MTALASPPIRTAPASRGIAPLRGESQAQFAERYHAAMAKAIPETDRRNVEMMKCWRQSGAGSDLDRCAAGRFRDAEFVHVPNVPVFSEHTTRDGKGNLVVYDRRALAAIVDRCNARILDTGDFPPLTEGHTPTPEEQNAGRKMPDVLGYAGPFRLGLIGNVNPRWAIFADEWHHQECADRLRRMQRRSPEVWLEERMEDRFLDPIAALGAETPRLDLGTARFGRRSDGRLVEKYSSAPVATGANTTYVPGATSGDDRKDRYEGSSMLNPEDVQQFVDAVLSTEPMAFLTENMPALQAMIAANPAAGSATPPPADPASQATLKDGNGAPLAPPMQVQDAPVQAPPAEADDDDGPYEPDDEDREQFRRYMAGECDDEEMQQYKAHKSGRHRRRRKQYAADGTVLDDAKPSGEGDVTTIAPQSKPNIAGADVADPALARHSRRSTMTHAERVAQARYQKLEEEVERLRAERDAEKVERRKADRYSKLADLRNHFAFEIDEEVEATEGFSDA